MYFASVVLIVPFKLKVIWLHMYVEYRYVYTYTINTKKEL